MGGRNRRVGFISNFRTSSWLHQHSNGRERSVKISKKFFVFTWVSRGSAMGKWAGIRGRPDGFICHFLTSAWESHHSFKQEKISERKKRKVGDQFLQKGFVGLESVVGLETECQTNMT